MAAYAELVNVVTNGSVTPKVSGSSFPGSGRLRMSRMRWFCQKQSPSATPKARSEMTILERSSSR